MSPRNRVQPGKPRILIVGGVAGGASCAARARRLSEEAEIIVFERGPYVSFANCGLPYYIGDVIPNESDLLVATSQYFRERFNIDVRVHSEVTKIYRQESEVEAKNTETGETCRERYDALVLSPGASPIRPSLPGIDLPGIFSVRTIPDSRQIREWMAEQEVKRAVIVGGGFIGLEMAENLVGRGISVNIIEMLPQVMPALDPEMAVLVHKHLVGKGVSLHLGDAAAGFEPGANGRGIIVTTQSGKKHPCDMVILAIGVRPEIKLAREAGLDIGALGGIRVDDRMRTSDDRIWAVGDAVEVRDVITGEWTLLALAGPASRQGRIAADVIMGRDSRFRGVQATAVCKVFDRVIASTGVSEKALRRSGINGKPACYEKVYLEPSHHVGYYPGAKPMMVKLIFSTGEGKILGVQVIGEEGVEKRVDVISMAIQKGATVFDLEEAELCYAPQFGGAKDPVNMAGMVAANVLRGDAPVVHWGEVPGSPATILDARTAAEFAAGHFEGAVNIYLNKLRQRIDELPRDNEILVYCRQGLRSYYATRILRQNGLNARNISGGMLVYDMWKKSGTT
jgi:NADPH-dependent 2,4-dienoyl-CoA reductase/sulfur reductase-like enzyme/rhodanese-related sulfurtransferase